MWVEFEPSLTIQVEIVEGCRAKTSERPYEYKTIFHPVEGHEGRALGYSIIE